MIYRLFRILARLTLCAFFKRIEVEGRDNVSDRHPVLLVPNHANSLVDPLVVAISLHRPVTCTAKNVLAKNPLLKAMFAGLGVIAFHRREDVNKGADRRQNVHSLERCREVLDAGGALCIFPEGVSHSDPKLRPFHTGAARIALDFVAKLSEKGSDPLSPRSSGACLFPETLHNQGGQTPFRIATNAAASTFRIVPVGLLYTDKDQFRSAVWLRFGAGIDVARWLKDHPGADAAALTDEIQEQVSRLTVNYATRREALILGRAADVVLTRGRMPPPLGSREASPAEWFRTVQQLQEGYRALLERHPAEVGELAARVRRYGAELKREGIEPPEVYLPVHWGKAALFAARELELVVVGAPLAVFGAINHLVPYLLVKGVARALSKDKDHWATNAIYPSFLVFPAFYVLQLTAAWLFLPAPWAAAYTLALPYTGHYALLYRDRMASVWRRTRTFLRWTVRRDEQERLAREGQTILEEIGKLDKKLNVHSHLMTKGPGS